MNIVFVCSGNASRSAAAEAVFKKMLAENNIEDIKVASCGTNVPEGLEREHVMCRIAAEYGYEMGGNAVPMTENLLNSADLIIVMTAQHRTEVCRLLTLSNWSRVIRFNEYCFHEATDLPDPHYHPERIYRTCFVTIERGCAEIIKMLKQ